MKRNENVLFKINDLELKLDLVLVDFIYPVLFTCLDEFDNMYIAACYRADGQSREWVIADTTPGKVVSLLKNEIQIREMFLHVSLWNAVLLAEDDFPNIRPVTAKELDANVLPTAGEYMDADSDEFESEIEELSKRARSGYRNVAVQRIYFEVKKTSFSCNFGKLFVGAYTNYGLDYSVSGVIRSVPA